MFASLVVDISDDAVDLEAWVYMHANICIRKCTNLDTCIQTIYINIITYIFMQFDVANIRNVCVFVQVQYMFLLNYPCTYQLIYPLIEMCQPFLSTPLSLCLLIYLDYVYICMYAQCVRGLYACMHVCMCDDMFNNIRCDVCLIVCVLMHLATHLKRIWMANYMK